MADVGTTLTVKEEPYDSSFVDDTSTFEACMRTRYSSMDDFIHDFRAFQLQTCTSFFIYNSETADHWRRSTGRHLPPGFPYQYAKFCCVHRRRKGNQGKRYKNYDCAATVIIRFVRSEYHVVKWSVKHSHTFQVGKPWLYVTNRRLTATEESQIYELVGSLSTHAIRQYAYSCFHKQLDPSDVRSIRLRCAKDGSIKKDDVELPLETVYVCDILTGDHDARVSSDIDDICDDSMGVSSSH
ncbi:unnamed protein product [Dicrocoelium dendriticum]|nr:unnamed protein product [Dicrocoelium dendriticum]